MYIAQIRNKNNGNIWELFGADYERDKENIEKAIYKERNNKWTAVVIGTFLCTCLVLGLSFFIKNLFVFKLVMACLFLSLTAFFMLDIKSDSEISIENEERYLKFWLRYSQNRVLSFKREGVALSYEYQDDNIVKTDFIIIDETIARTDIEFPQIAIKDKCIYYIPYSSVVN